MEVCIIGALVTYLFIPSFSLVGKGVGMPKYVNDSICAFSKCKKV